MLKNTRFVNINYAKIQLPPVELLETLVERLIKEE